MQRVKKVLRALIGRLRGDDVAALRAEIADLRELILSMNHALGVLEGLNHDVRSGSEQSLPLFLGYAERFRTDADSAIGAAVVIQRQVARLEQLIDGLGAVVPPSASDA